MWIGSPNGKSPMGRMNGSPPSTSTDTGTVAVVNSSAVVAVGIAATVVAIIGYVRYRQREGFRLDQQAALAGRLRDLAGDDLVRLAAVDEFETRIYQQLFGVSTVGPRATATAWAMLATVLAAAGTLAAKSGDGAAYEITFYLLLVLAVISGITFLVLLALAVHAATSLPRISFDDSYTEVPDSLTAPAPRAPAASD